MILAFRFRLIEVQERALFTAITQANFVAQCLGCVFTRTREATIERLIIAFLDQFEPEETDRPTTPRA